MVIEFRLICDVFDVHALVIENICFLCNIFLPPPTPEATR